MGARWPPSPAKNQERAGREGAGSCHPEEDLPKLPSPSTYRTETAFWDAGAGSAPAISTLGPAAKPHRPGLLLQEHHHLLPPAPGLGNWTLWYSGKPRELDPRKTSHCEDRSEGDGTGALTGCGEAPACTWILDSLLQHGELHPPSAAPSQPHPTPGQVSAKQSRLPGFPEQDAVDNHRYPRGAQPSARASSEGVTWGAQPWQTLCHLPAGQRSTAVHRWAALWPRCATLLAAAGLNPTWALRNATWLHPQPCSPARSCQPPHQLSPSALLRLLPVPAAGQQLLLSSLRSGEGFH